LEAGSSGNKLKTKARDDEEKIETGPPKNPRKRDCAKKTLKLLEGGGSAWEVLE